MSARALAATIFTAGALIGGCSAPGLPPAGPAPGEIDAGYGTQDAGEVTGAVSALEREQFSDSRAVSVEELLRGRVPGLHISTRRDGRISLRIRGTNSMLHDEAPLLVVDGIQISSGDLHRALAGVSPADIRHVTVLRDVASTSIYGMRGAGGVILITTRR